MDAIYGNLLSERGKILQPNHIWYIAVKTYSTGALILMDTNLIVSVKNVEPSNFKSSIIFSSHTIIHNVNQSTIAIGCILLRSHTEG